MANKRIPKQIFYFWQKDKPLTALGLKCIFSWKKFFPGYDIIQIDESNFDVYQCDYSKVAWEAKRYAYLSDYARVKTIFKKGGIYFDLDVEAVADMRNIVERGSFFCLSGYRGKSVNVATGLGFAAYRGHKMLGDIVKSYEAWRGNRFYDDRNFPVLPACPLMNWPVFSKFGVKSVDKVQIIGDTTFYPTSFFEPLNFVDRVLRVANETKTIHWYNDKNKYVKADSFLYFYKASLTKRKGAEPSDRSLKISFLLFHPIMFLKYRYAHRRRKYK